jgi:microcystin-dependent protein
MLPTAFTTYNNISKSMDQAVVADQMKIISRAAREYTRTNFSTLAAATNPTTSKKLSVQQLVSSNYLPQGFANTNIWGQNYEVWIAQPNDGNLQPLVLTQGGDKLAPEFGTLEIPQTARKIGAMGGFIPAISTTGAPVSPQKAQGVAGGWEVNLAAHGIPSPGPGHLVALAEFTSVEDPSVYLHRKKIIGRPELNRMETNLSLSDNDIEDINKLTASNIHAEKVALSDGQITGAGAIQFESHEKADFSCSASPEENGQLFLVDDEGLYICRKGELTRIHDDANFIGAPVGSVIAWAGDTTPPEDWLECDGSTFSAAQYPLLKKVLGGNTLPDLRGEFIRGWDHGRGVDIGRAIGSWQKDQNKRHQHADGLYHDHKIAYRGEKTRYSVRRKAPLIGNGDHGRPTSSYNTAYRTYTSAEGADDARPRNIALMYIIKAA